MNVPNPVNARELIIAALMEWIGSRPFEAVSVSQIVKKAGISRSTFYLYYRDKFDLMDSVTAQITDRFLSFYRNEIRPPWHQDAPFLVQETTLALCTHIQTNRTFYADRFKDPHFVHQLTRRLTERLFAIYRHQGYATFAGYGTIGYLSQWVLSGFRLTPFEASTELTKIGLTNWAEMTSPTD
ncbi:TetR family transcriptional regulator [Paenibacillus albicereus]|uniref:TetR family transcriptional regulator n=1 Tax=Paenibacillus albicereus TaxID=2726185 RepID=A0A6H2GUX2_9BACL|nr:TetR/AcrR family transcriptional regulator [Paenibacillus albicereus]QJC51210.1 TetR family transcriptional regulator [Paenibacillus albicereus]